MNSKRILTLHAKRYPAMAAEDYVKLLYQSEFGPGHMVDAGDGAMLERLEAEFDRASAEGYAPAYTVEAIGGGLCRLHLDPRQLKKEDLPLVLRCFAASAESRGSKEGLWTKLGLLAGLSWTGELPLDVEELEAFLARYDDAGTPAISHSEGYREAYTPHYRVMDRDLALYLPALKAIDKALRETEGPVIAAVDGRCASGKSTFARRAAQVFDSCSVFHMDDFFLPFEKRTPERLAAPGGNVDYERAAAEVFEPLSRGEEVALRVFDCSDGSFGEPETIPFRRLNIVEGSYSLHPALSGYSQVHIFLTCSPEAQMARLEKRESEKSLQNFKDRWIPMEEAYFEKLSVMDQCDVVVDTTKLPGRGEN